ncbi:glycosyltransferase family 2 protein [Kiritimatiellaeota bacterium B1221]|nr:glycosyltransferase family 2 protein [Kiritimatiellaeota bacterium B1221]
MHELVIHLLNYRTPDLTIDCLYSLAKERANYADFKVMLIDNASGDDSVPRFEEILTKEAWSDWVEFLPLPKNLGFAGGNNASINQCLEQESCPPYQLLLNSDTLVHAGALKLSMEWMREHTDAGAFSCMLRNADGSVQNVCRKFPRPDRETARALGLPYILPKWFHWAELEDMDWDRETAVSREVEWVGGAFMLLRTEAIRKAGVLNEDFFFYGEDCEWCYRLRSFGWKIYFDPTASITHFGGGSSDTTRLLDKRREILTWKARFMVQRCCYGRVAALWVRAVYIYAFGMRVIWLFATGRRKTLKYKSIKSGFSTLTHPLDPDRK